MSDGNDADHEQEQQGPFDFAEHRRTAVEEYLRDRPKYEAFAAAVRNILLQALKARGIAFNSVDARAKEPDSFGDKSAKPSDKNPDRPKYKRPVQDITDLAGIRVITFFPRTVGEIDACIREEFEVVEHTDPGQTLFQEERFGYQSKHYLIRMNGERTKLPEYKPHVLFVAEVQVRTILQHAWAEIEHEIQYKASIRKPTALRRRFRALAGMFEIADREFQAIQDEDTEPKQEEGPSREEALLGSIEITTDVLRSYLDKRVGTDARVSNFSYEWMARTLRKLGFKTIQQVERCIEGYDDDEVSRISWGGRQGPIKRFEDMLLAGMGSVFVERGTDDAEWRDLLKQTLTAYEENNIPIRQYDPQADG